MQEASSERFVCDHSLVKGPPAKLGTHTARGAVGKSVGQGQDQDQGSFGVSMGVEVCMLSVSALAACLFH